MPEGVEIRKFADILSANIIGHNITSINILKGRYTKKLPIGFNKLLEYLPVIIKSVNTKGKFTYLELESLQNNLKKFWLFSTLGLTGGWTVAGKNKSVFKNVSNIKYLKSKNGNNELIYAYPIIWEYINDNNLNEWFERALNHLNVEFILDNDLIIYFYDQLSFGTLSIIENQHELDKKLKDLGPDIMNDTTTFEVFKKQIIKKINNKKMIGNIIVNQKIISGIGNYLRADALWMSNISPFRKIEDILDNELELLYKSIRALMWGDYNYNEGIKKGIITKGFKIPRDYGQEFFVYRQNTDINGHKVSKKELYEGNQKRTIFWVPETQK
jgi:formamidopyrimidine-DNA glycosylase